MPTIKKPDTDERLEFETKKWLEKLEARMGSVTVEKGVLEKKVTDNAMENVSAYIKDCRHFLSEKDFVNAFEAIIYAWGIFETLERAGLVKG
jgi:hypothetical protein